MAADMRAEESDASKRARLVESLSASFPGSALSRALHAMDEDQENAEDPLSSSCFASIRLDKVKIEEEEDDELTSLAWLQDNDLLKNLRAGEDLFDSPSDELQKENAGGNQGYAPQTHPPHVPYNPQKHVNSKPPYSFSCLIFMAIEDSPCKKLPVKDIYSWILNHFPYFQNAPTGWKNSVRHNLSLNKCFKKVEKEKGQSIGKGSLWCIDPDYRPNLLQALRKTPYHPYHQLQMLANPGLLNGPNYTVLPGTNSYNQGQRFSFNNPSPHLFPFLSRRLAQSQSQFDTESDIDVANALVSLKSRGFHSSNPRLRPLSVQNGNYRERSPSPPEFGSEEEKRRLKRHRTSSPYRRRPRSPIVCTEIPSEDHTYSVSGTAHSRPLSPASVVSSIDEEYEFGHNGHVGSDLSDSERCESDFGDGLESETESGHGSRSQDDSDYVSPHKKKRPLTSAEEEDEEKKIVEGADALLNLAGIKTSSIVPLRSISPTTTNNNNNIIVKQEKDESTT